MVTDIVKIRDKYASAKKILLIFGIIVVVGLVLGGMFMFGFFTGKKEIILVNPLENIVFMHTDSATGLVNEIAVVEQGILEFNEEYINYLLAALGTGYLHKSFILENPFIEFVLGDEVWNSEIKGGMPNSVLGEIDNEDLRVTLSKEEAVKALLSDNVGQFVKDSYSNGNLGIEMIAGKAELFSKGYLEMYKELTGQEISADDVE